MGGDTKIIKNTGQFGGNSGGSFGEIFGGIFSRHDSLVELAFKILPKRPQQFCQQWGLGVTPASYRVLRLEFRNGGGMSAGKLGISSNFWRHAAHRRQKSKKCFKKIGKFRVKIRA